MKKCFTVITMKKKKILIVALLLCLCSIISACSQRQGIDFENVLSVTVISVKTGAEKEIHGETFNNLVSIWKNGEWHDDVTKTVIDYIFVINGNIELHYSSYGIFNDRENNFSLKISEEHKAYINSIFN